MHRDRSSHHDDLLIGLLGPLSVTRQGVFLELPRSRKTRGLLAYLALAERPARREDLCNLLWDGAADPRAELRWSLSKIRAAVGACLQILPEGIAFRCGGQSTDAARFRRLALEPLSEQSIADALALWRGLPLADVEVRGQPAFQAWLTAERETLGALRTKLLKAAVDQAWARPEVALSAARRLVAEEPWNEWGHGRVVQLLERCGRTGDAAKYLSAIRQSLSRELGIAETRLLNALPPVQDGRLDQARSLKRSVRPAVRIEPFKLIPSGEALETLQSQVSAGISLGLWRSRFCDVRDEDDGKNVGSADADFAVRGSIVQYGGTAQICLRCVNLHLKTIVWSGQVELKAPNLRGLTRWIRESVEAMRLAVCCADLRSSDPGTLQASLTKARLLARALLPEANAQALDLLNRILTENADEPEALALAAWSWAQRAVYNWSANPQNDRAEAKYCAAMATEVGVNDPQCLVTIAAARTLVADQNGAEVLLDRALRLDPQAPPAHVRSGWLANYMDEPGRAMHHFRTAIRLAPLDEGSFNARAGLGVAHFIGGDYVQAIRGMEQALSLNPKALWIYRNLVPAYVAAGDHKKTEDGLFALTEAYPRLTVAAACNAMVFSPNVMAKIADGLRCAGLPQA